MAVVHVGFYDADRFSHGYPSKVYGPLGDHWQRDEWTISAQCPSTVHVAFCDKWGEKKVWFGKAGDTFVQTDEEQVSVIV